MTLFPEGKLLIATHNSGKLEEFKSILRTLDLELTSSKELNLPEPKEIENTFLGNARIKSRAACLYSNLPSMADDSGLEVHALDNQPGVYTADWAETGTGRDFKKAMEYLWTKLTLTKESEPFTATFCCTLVLTFPNGKEKIFEGKVEGRLVRLMKGQEGHGYDPIFLPNGYKKTFGEMKNEQKNSISHRFNALNKFLTYYQSSLFNN